MGSRSCIGRNLALVEVHKYIAQFFRHFDAEIVNKDNPWVTKSQVSGCTELIPVNCEDWSADND